MMGNSTEPCPCSAFSRLSNLTSLDISFNSEMDTQEVNKVAEEGWGGG